MCSMAGMESLVLRPGIAWTMTSLMGLSSGFDFDENFQTVTLGNLNW